MLLEYTPGSTFLHRADVRSKLLAFIVLIIAAFMLTSPLLNLGLSAMITTLLFLLGMRPRAILNLFAPLVFVVVLIFIFAAFSPPRGADPTTLVHLWPHDGLPLTVGGIQYGANLALRIMTMVAASALLIMSTPIEQFTTLMQRMHVPHSLVFILATALRFVPTMQGRSDQILDAQRARGARLDSGGAVGKIRAYVTIMVPLFSTGIRMSEELSSAMISRGYGVVKHPTLLYDLKWRPVDTLISLTAAALLISTVAWRILVY